jgi:predicted nucleic acid-binding protein
VANVARFLIDTSAAARMPRRVVADRLAPLIQAGVVATCATLDAEALFSVRSPAEYEEVRADRRTAYEYVPTEDEHWQRAFAAQRELARTGRHRGVGVPDLLTAVLAAEHRLTVIHYDAHFDTAGEVIDFGRRWIAEPGSIA